jgi:putative ABC transport system permease protein
MSLGLAAGVMLMLFVVDELSFDNFHKKRDRIYKVVTASPDGGMETNAWPVARKLESEFPEVEAAVYTKRGPSSMMVNYEGNRYSHDFFYADENFFKLFTFKFTEGDPERALAIPFSIVITEKIKERYFGNEVILGKTITLRDSIDFIISGVIKNVPRQSHMQFEMLASFSTYQALFPGFSFSEGWGNFNVRNYILLEEGADAEVVKSKTRDLYRDNIGEWMNEMGVDFSVDLISLNDVYLESGIGNGFGPSGSKDQLKMVSIIGLFIILLACINFVNITTARSVYRAREVGIRKLAGSSKISLFWQFLSEAFLLTILSFILALLTIELTLPLFNNLMGKSYQFSSLFELEIGIGILTLILLMTITAGYYPAIVLSNLGTSEAIKGRVQNSAHGIQLRRGLVIAQFSISATLVLGTLIIVHQLNYMRNQDLGFNKDQILVVDATNAPIGISPEVFKTMAQGINSIETISFTNALPGRPGWQGQWAFPDVMSNENHVDTEYMAIDENYLDALGITLIAGNNFDLNNPAELQDGLIINESTVEAMGWSSAQDALGKRIVSPSQYPEGTVIGVVKDYHGQGLQHEIWPKAMDYSSDKYGRYFAVKFKTGNTSQLISSVKNQWSEIYSDYDFDYFFLNQDFDRQYKAEDRLMTVFVLFALIGIIIACIGLLGMVTFMLNTRMKEISIRKVHGASVPGITVLLSKEFLILVILANLIVLGPAWYFGKNWLNNFAYHTTLSPALFMVNFIIMLSLAFMTVSFQIFKASLINPVRLLRND